MTDRGTDRLQPDPPPLKYHFAINLNRATRTLMTKYVTGACFTIGRADGTKNFL
jgi:hypothetical protein